MEIINVNYLGSKPEFQEYSDKDLSLVNFNVISRNFGLESDYIEYFIYDLNNNLLASNYNVSSYSIKGVDPINNENNTITLNPDQDVKNEGFDRGAVNITYNFFRKLFNSSDSNRFWISDISTDRTELKVFRQDLSNDELQILFNEYNVEASSKNYYQDFYLNFGDNTILIGVNLLYALSNEQASLLIKLYEPLPDIFNEKDTFWIVDKLSEPATYNIDIQIPAEVVITRDTLQGPNFNIDISEKVGQTTNYLSLGTIFNNSVSSSYRQLKSLVDEKGYDINVDYTDFSKFIHFSSAVERITNFAYKIQLIEGYNADISSLNTVTGNTNTISSSVSLLQNKIDDIVEKFDGYEYYLYFESGSDAWPKSNSDKPYNLYSYSSSQAVNWLGSINTVPSAGTHSILYSASIYDLNNKDWLLNTIPSYLKDDPNNEPYQIFLSMIGQHFDNIWIYIKDITNRYNAENSLDKGISRDEVADALRSLGIKLYTNTNISDNIFYSLIGTGPEGQTLPPTGSEVINSYVTSSAETMPADDITTEYYKRIYHNLPYILKNKGTNIGLRALINCFGIPDTILRINEFGGSDKLASTPDLIQDDYIVSYYNTGSNSIQAPWGPSLYQFISSSYSTVVPDSIEFNFRNIDGIPSSSLYYTQSLFQVGAEPSLQFGVNLKYDPTTAISGTLNQYYGEMRLYLNGNQGIAVSNPISLPFFDPTKWWNVIIKRKIGGVNALNNNIDNEYILSVKNALYNQNGGDNIGFSATSSIYISGSVSSSYNNLWNYYNQDTTEDFFRAYIGGADSDNILSQDGVRYQGLIHDFRYWAEPISESIQNIHAQNINSFAGNSTTSSIYSLIYRLPLGNNLQFPSESQVIKTDYNYNGSIIRTYNISESILYSYHPAVSGTFFITSSNSYVNGIGSIKIINDSVSYGFHTISGSKTYYSEQIYNLIATPSTGLSQKVNNKINIVTENELSSSLLSREITIQNLDDNISRNSYDIEVGFSPADSIDQDITNQLGYFNIDEYIGNPSDQYQDTYQDLSTLRKTYFQKYQSSFKIWDFVRLLKYYDNSLFKMIKDFVPARANLSTGIIVKPHILERSKYKRNEPIFTQEEFTGSIDMITITGSNPEGESINTDYSSFVTTSLGYLPKNNNDRSQPFTGEFGGSEIFITDGEFLDYETSNIITPDSAGYVTYSLDPLMNNISSSIKSKLLLDIDYSSNPNIPVNNNLITGAFDLYNNRADDINDNSLDSQYWPFAEVEDYNYNLFSYNNIRYDGTKVISKNYNKYSSGDTSYGKTAAVDYYVKKIGLFTQIESSSFLKNRNNATLTHLIDEQGNYTALDRSNLNWQELQNTFKNSTAVISLFDNQKYNNQKFTNGIKKIYNVGYSYEPVFYFLNTGSENTASFQYAGDGQDYTFRVAPSPKQIVAGSGSSSTYGTFLKSNNEYTVTNLFDFTNDISRGEFNGGVYYNSSTTGSYSLPSYFNPIISSRYSFNTELKVLVDYGAGSGQIGLRLNIYNSAGTIDSVTQSFNGTSFSYANIQALNVPGYTYTIFQSGTSIPTSGLVKILDSAGNIVQTYDNGVGFIPYTVTYTPTTPTSYTYRDRFRSTPDDDQIESVPFNISNTLRESRQQFSITTYKPAGSELYTTAPIVGTEKSTVLNLISNITDVFLAANDAVFFELLIDKNGLEDSDVTVTVLDGGFLTNDAKGGIPTVNSPFISFDFDNNNIIITGSLAVLYDSGYIFLPSGSASGSNIVQPSLLYDNYGDVNYPFSMSLGDIILLNSQTGSVTSELTVNNAYKINNYTVNINVSPGIPANINNTLYSAIFLNKIPDETNTILEFAKKQGKTSYGFLIPDNIDPNLLKNIDLISKEVQTKLLSDQINTVG